MTDSGRHRWRRWLTGGALLCILGFVVWSAVFGSGDAATQRDARAALRPMVDQGNERVSLPEGEWIAGNGVIEPVGGEARLALDSPGRIATIAVREGQQVDAAAVLVSLDDAQEQAALRAADSEVRVARAQLDRTRRGVRREDVDAITAEADAARARADQSARERRRVEELARASAVSADEVERSRSQEETERALLQSADARRRAAVAGARLEDVEVARAQLGAAEARRQQAVVALEARTLRAPWRGTVLQVKYRAGERYSPERDALVVLGDLSRLVARVDVDERDLAGLRLGARAFVVAPSQPGHRVPGLVAEIGGRLGRKNVRTDDPVERIDTKILEVVVSLDAHAELLPGSRVLGYISRR